MTTPTTDPAIRDVIGARGITDVLHFTTNHGLVGCADSDQLVSRDQLDATKRLEFIALPNCENRLKDAAWTDYVNMSITVVNSRMLGVSTNWHQHRADFYWVVLRFSADILTHPGVQFVTTNNTYSGVLKRGTGADALEALFAPRVAWGHYGSEKVRAKTRAANLPTDVQAEVLYPRAASLTYLTGIYVPNAELLDEVHSLQTIFPNLAAVPVEHRPEVFT